MAARSWKSRKGRDNDDKYVAETQRTMEKCSLARHFLVVLFVSGSISDVDLARFFSNSSQMNVILQKMAHPDWAYAKIIVEPILQTIQMAIIGTTFGALAAFPFSLLAARNIMTNHWISGCFRFVLNIIRTVPDLMLAALFVAIVGIGPVAG